MKTTQIGTVLLIALFAFACKPEVKKAQEKTAQKITKPNIIIIYADDLGFGDVSSYGATELKTVNMDRIGEQGIRFTNGYATSPTCTPSRFSMLSGIYPFRSKRAQILPGNASLLFDTSKQTLPSMLQKAGYTTGVVGKWHLGLGDKNLDWNGKITPGPREIGFDYSYIMASTNDRVPSVYVKNHHIDGLDPSDPIAVSYKKNFEGEPTGKDNPELLKLFPSHGHDMSINNGISRIGFMKGGKSALFTDENMGDDFLKETLKFININKETPFFLFYSLHQPHVPRVPNERFAGKSGLGPRGDVILEADWEVGQVLDELDRLKLTENTIVIFSSDNGPVLDDGYKDDAVIKIGKHTPTGGLRGGKYSLFDAGTHIPFMIKWPAKIKAGTTSDALVCQMDFLASFAALTGQKINSSDSENILDALLGKSDTGRAQLILGQGKITSFRSGDYVLIPPHKGSKMTNKFVNIETGRSLEMQLYNLRLDRKQTKNLAKTSPELVAKMLEEIKLIKAKKH